MISKHNWFYESSISGYRCSVRRNVPDVRGRWQNCFGCGAEVSIDEVYQYEGRNQINSSLHSRSARYPRAKELETIDKLWHEELRPMADLVGLVEEAACQ